MPFEIRPEECVCNKFRNYGEHRQEIHKLCQGLPWYRCRCGLYWIGDLCETVWDSTLERLKYLTKIGNFGGWDHDWAEKEMKNPESPY